MSYRAIHRYARISPRKVRPVTQLISGMYVEDARHTLKGIHNRGARFVEKVLASAAANAEDRGVRQVAELRVVEARVDPVALHRVDDRPDVLDADERSSSQHRPGLGAQYKRLAGSRSGSPLNVSVDEILAVVARVASGT